MDSCSWCHTLNPADAVVCKKCSHDAHVPRVQCQCYQCTCFPASITGGKRAPAETTK